MIELERPLKDQLREPPRPAVDALWHRIQTRRSRSWRLVPDTWRWLLPAAGLAAAWLISRAYLSSHPPALLLDDGRAIATVRTGAEARVLTLSDGSRLELGPDTQLAPRSLDQQQFVSELVRGRVTLDVVPHGPRRWTIRAGDVQVSVLGTRFDVERGARGVAVDVERGLVEVSGPGVPNGSRRLGAGERLFVSPASPAASSREGASDAPAVGAGAPASDAGDPPAAVSDSEAKVPSPGASSKVRTRGRTVPAAALDAGAVGIEELLASADTARRSGQAAAAARALRQVVDHHPSDPRSALAAFTLGQLYLDQLARPDLAARALVQARTVGLPNALAEEGTARLVEAFSRSGQHDRAHEAGLEYLARYPKGRRFDQVERWMRLR